MSIKLPVLIMNYERLTKPKYSLKPCSEQLYTQYHRKHKALQTIQASLYELYNIRSLPCIHICQ